MREGLIFSKYFFIIYSEVNLNILLAIATHRYPKGKQDSIVFSPVGNQNESVWSAENNGGVHFPEPNHGTAYTGQR